MPSHLHRERGVTLIELLATLGVVAIAAAIAAPSFNHLRYDAQRTTTVNEFFHALFLARSESIRRGRVVSLCRSVDGQTCATNSAAWSDGWIVFVNEDRDEPAVRDPGEELLKAYDAWPQGTITSNRATYSFRPHVQAVVNGTIIFCDPRGSAHARAIIISQTGRPRVTRTDSSGKPLKC
jgi:type IV fimbrial biogenesis protein FimT